MTLENNINPVLGKIVQSRPATQPVEYPTAFPEETEVPAKNYAPLPPPSGRLPALPPSIASSAAALAGKTKVYLAMVDDDKAVLDSSKLLAEDIKENYPDLNIDVTAALSPDELVKSLNEKLEKKNADEKPYILLITDGMMEASNFVDSVKKVSKLAKEQAIDLITPILRSGAGISELESILQQSKGESLGLPFVEDHLVGNFDSELGFDIYDTAGLGYKIKDEIDLNNLTEDAYVYTMEKDGNFINELDGLFSHLDSILNKK